MLTIDELKKLCEDSQILEYCLPVLDNPQFLTCPLNLEESLPYSCTSGLLNYTYEIISSGVLLCSLYKTYKGISINIREYIISAIWCNYGKLLDYVCLDADSQVWKYSESHSKIPTSHQSAMQFKSYISSLENFNDIENTHGIYFTNIIHNILSISTNQPQTPEAHILVSTSKLAHSLNTPIA